MKKATVFVVFFLVAGAVFGQEDIFENIDTFISNFPQTNQEARDRLASWGYINDNNPIDFFIQYYTKYSSYEVWVMTSVIESITELSGNHRITFRLIFPRQESIEFYQLYRATVNYFTEKYINFNKTIENNNHILTNGDIIIYIGYNNTEVLFIDIVKRRNR